MEHWTDFGVGQLPSFSARKKVEFPPPIEALVGERVGAVRQSLQGLTSDGTVRAGLFPLRSTGVSTAPITDAASRFLGALCAEQRQRAVFPLDAEERRMWLNIHPFVFRHGVMLEDLPPATRQLGLRLLEASLSARGFAQARDIMRLNRLLAEVTGFPDDFGEWPYFLSFYGEPSAERPWAWQIDGHHLCLNGTDDLPPELQDFLDGRMQAGAFRDNAVVAYAGVCAADLTGIQRRCLRALVAAYVGWTCEGHSGVKMSEVDQHLDETYFAWMGAVADDGPFYYRVQSPVVLIEFDHHPGVAFDNVVPSRNHIHTIIRTPNGGDYGLDLLRQHHERFDHSTGIHIARP